MQNVWPNYNIAPNLDFPEIIRDDPLLNYTLLGAETPCDVAEKFDQ